MARIEDQRILVWCNNKVNLQTAIVDAAYLAIKLEKEVCLFANFNNAKEEKALLQRVGNYAQILKRDVPELNVSTLMLKGKLHRLMGELGEKYNTILLCCGKKMSNQLLKAFYRSRFPLFFSKQEPMSEQRFKKLIVPIDFRNNTKEAALWGSYMGRFNQSEIVLLVANDQNDNDLQPKVDGVVAFVKNLYNQFLFNFWFDHGKAGSWGIHKEAMRKVDEFDLLIFTGSLYVTLPDYLIGPFEKRIINQCKTSVLLINPQKEMYVLCS